MNVSTVLTATPVGGLCVAALVIVTPYRDMSHRGREKICIMVAVSMFIMLNMSYITHL